MNVYKGLNLQQEIVSLCGRSNSEVRTTKASRSYQVTIEQNDARHPLYVDIDLSHTCALVGQWDVETQNGVAFTHIYACTGKDQPLKSFQHRFKITLDIIASSNILLFRHLAVWRMCVNSGKGRLIALNGPLSTCHVHMSHVRMCIHPKRYTPLMAYRHYTNLNTKFIHAQCSGRCKKSTSLIFL